jgi:MGT family glycosyltransferase
VAHIGILPLPYPGHLYPSAALGAHLKGRGHRVTFFGLADAEAFVTNLGFDYVAISREQCPVGYTRRVTEELGKLRGRRGLKFTIEVACKRIDATMGSAPAAIREAAVEALVLDQAEMAGSTVAEHLKLPYVHLANALMLNMEPDVPPFSMGWGVGGPLTKLRNRAGNVLVRRLTRPICDKVNAHRRAFGLRPFGEFMNERFGDPPQISQQPRGFDFPRTELPPNFHYVGPLHSADSRSRTAFAWDRLGGRPLIYASLGTIQNRLAWAFRAIAEGCAKLNAQLVISLGGGIGPEQFENLPGDPIVVPFAPQLEMLTRAAVCITHAGLNTVLESLTNGVPMVSVPITNDQPGVAARMRWTGSGEVVPIKKLNAASVREAVSSVLAKPHYRENARKLRDEIAGLKPLERASEIVESILDIR